MISPTETTKSSLLRWKAVDACPQLGGGVTAASIVVHFFGVMGVDEQVEAIEFVRGAVQLLALREISVAKIDSSLCILSLCNRLGFELLDDGILD